MMEPLGAKVVGTPAPLQLELDHDLVCQFRPEARRRDMSVAMLIRSLLDMVVADGLVSAILDAEDDDSEDDMAPVPKPARPPPKPAKPPPITTIDAIQVLVCKSYGIPHSKLIAERRTKKIVEARQLAMFLAKRLALKSLPEIGRSFGGRNHTTVLHAARKVAERCLKDADYCCEVVALENILQASANPS
jgi:hypothetical protein